MMRPFQHTIPLHEARAQLDAAARPLDRVERVGLALLASRVVAEDLVATTDVPPFARAMMDGYAVRAADTAGATRGAPRLLDKAGHVFTGETFDGVLEDGRCVEIATGAPMPDGADAVVMVEDTAGGADGRVHVCAQVSAGQHVGRRGADITAGATVIRSGDVLLPSRVGVVASLGLQAVMVYARPRVAIVSTGNEVVPPGTALGPGQIYDINRYTLSSVVEAHGAVAVQISVAGDTLAELDLALDEALGCDVVVLSGGSSVGERDLVLDVLRRRGTVVFHGIATRPGKPTAFGRIGEVPVFGMPGNPASCLTNAYVLLVPFIRALAHLPPHEPRVVSAPLTRRVTSSVGRHQFYTVRLVEAGAEPAFKASGDITSMAHADGYIEIDAEVAAVEAGTTVRVVIF